MLKEILNLKSRQLQDVTGFSLRQEGSIYCIYSNFADRPQQKIGRYKSYEEARKAFDLLKELTISK